MELSPFAIERVSFAAVRRGYDRSQVDEFVSEAAAAFEELTSRLRDAMARLFEMERRLALAEDRARHAEEVLVIAIEERLAASPDRRIEFAPDHGAGNQTPEATIELPVDVETSAAEFAAAKETAARLLDEYRSRRSRPPLEHQAPLL